MAWSPTISAISQPGHGVYAFLLNPQGHILGDLYAYNRGESLLVDTDQSQLEKILAVFDKYIIMDDVEVAERHRPAGRHRNRRTEVPAKCYRQLDSRCPTSSLCNLSQTTWQQICCDSGSRRQPMRGIFRIVAGARRCSRKRTRGTGESRSQAGGDCGARPVAHRRRNSALRHRHPRTRLAAGNRAGTRLEFLQGLLRWPGDCGAHSLARPGAPQIHRL